MKWVVRQGDATRDVEVERVPDGFEVVMGSERRRVDLIRLDEAMASLRYVDDGQSYSVSYHRGKGREWRLAGGERDFDLEVLTPVEAIEASAVGRNASPPLQKRISTRRSAGPQR